MSDTNDLFTQLWQSQATQTLDIQALKRDFARQKWKQKLYLLFDFLAMLPMLYIFFFMNDKFSTAAFIGFSAMVVVALSCFGYTAWLRRHALLGQAESTLEYLALLRSQYVNNQRIAWLTKHSIWVSMLMLIAFYGMLFFIGEVKDGKLPILIYVIIGFSVVGAFIYRWAHKRELMFRDKVEQLDSNKV